MDKSLKKGFVINRFPVVIYFVLIFATLMVVISALAPVNNHEKKAYSTYSDFSTGWLNSEESEASLDHLSGTTVIHRTITAADCNKTLFFFAKTSNIKVLIDGVCRYRNKYFSSQLFGKTPGALFVNVLIPEGTDGKLLTIEIENPYEDDDSAKLDEMYIGDISDIMQFQQQKRFNPFCISLIIMAIGVVMLLLFIPLTQQRIVGIEFLNLGATAFVAGVYLTTDGRYLQLVFGDAHIYHMIAEVAMRLVIPTFLLFLSQMYDSYSKRISAILCIIGEIVFAGSFICEITGIMDYHETLFSAHVVFAISMLFILASTIKGLVKTPKENIYHNIGCIVVSLMALTDIIVLWRGTGHETSYFVRLGILIFFFLEIVQIMKKFLASYQRNIKNELLSRLAYHDGLTDLLNRTSYMEKVKELEADENSYMLFAIYDVNNLKKVNDTMGHQKGDEMIKRVADVMSASLGKYGQCYRIGGDEFVFISTKPDIEDVFINASKTMLENLGCITDGNDIVPITAAMGYAVQNENSTKDVNEIIREADSRMYEKKRTMKHRKA